MPQTMVHIPLLRQGRSYESLDAVEVLDYRTREPFARISHANPGLIRRDLQDQKRMRQVLESLSSRELLEICGRAAESFTTEPLPLGDNEQSPQDYIEQLCATTGLPHVLIRKNVEKIRTVLSRMEEVMRGLTRGLDLAVLDHGYGFLDGQALSYVPEADALGVILPSNSPGVHSLWLPAIALKTSLVLKPGSAEPWTPFRIVQSFIRAGCPPEAFGYYPTDHAGASEILRHCGRSMLFGDVTAVRKWAGDPRVELHGPGYSKIVIGGDRIDRWEEHLDLLIESVLENGGRSCVNASGIWVSTRSEEIAWALAQRLAEVEPLPPENHRAQLVPFTDPQVAARISQMIDADLSIPGARDLTAKLRGSGRLINRDGCSYLLPTVIHCETPEHPLANREFLFPFVSVVETPGAELVERLGPSLVVTALTSDDALIKRLLSSPHVSRLNLGAIPTHRVSWDQPHEGNLFEHLYTRRAFQMTAS